jgi:23S rRNA (adenine2503-C2)-methyltransferase
VQERVNLLGLSKPELREFLVGIGAQAYRADQILKWIHHESMTSFDDMNNLSKAFREQLAECAVIEPPVVHQRHTSKDGTRKWLFKVEGGSLIEAVYIPEPTRATLCISSQAGCSLNCSFCHTGKQGFHRDLTSHEIIGQIWTVCHELKAEKVFLPGASRVISNVVMMGMGEPLMNTDNVLRALRIMVDDLGYGLAKKRVTLSTSGVVPNIDKLSDAIDVSLAVSLHAPTNELRNILVPINKKYPIEVLLAACQRYIAKQKNRVVTMEYVMLKNVNDSPLQAKQLGKILANVPCKINLIPFNPFKGSEYERSTDAAIELFQTILMKAGYVTTIRKTRGDEIAAACGQLAGQIKDKTKRQERFLAKIPVSEILSTN